MAVDLHLRQDHLGSAIKGLAALGAQVFLMQDSASHKCYNITGKSPYFILSFGILYTVKAKSGQTPQNPPEQVFYFYLFFFFYLSDLREELLV